MRLFRTLALAALTVLLMGAVTSAAPAKNHYHPMCWPSHTHLNVKARAGHLSRWSSIEKAYMDTKSRTVMVHMRSMVDAIGGKTVWDEASHMATFTYRGQTLKVKLPWNHTGPSTAYLNGVKVHLPTLYCQGYLYASARDVANMLQASIRFNQPDAVYIEPSWGR